MNSFQKNEESYKNLRNILNELFGQNDAKITSFEEKQLLTFVTSSDAVGFALIRDSVNDSYSIAYAEFKQYYRDNHTELQAKNLSFVVCTLNETTKEEQNNLSAIEKDVYFCRKYVVRLSKDRKESEHDLLRLPFLPIKEDQIKGVIRPPSAQTLLRSSGLSAQLSKYLIVPNELAANNIINFVGQFEYLPTLETKLPLSSKQEMVPLSRTRLKEVVIDTFRAYKRRQVFDVDSDLVILYGPNGLGKTSFFDAIDYACTGRIGRLCSRSSSQSEFVEFARHLSSKDANTGSVTLKFNRDDSEHMLTRSIGNWSNAKLDSDELDRANVIQFLTSAPWGEKKERIENLERLFRSTHLFSQSSAELLIEFEKNSTLSDEIVTKMISLEDYHNGSKKINEILKILSVQISSEKEQLEDLHMKLFETEKKISSLPKIEDQDNTSKKLMDMTNQLVMNIHSMIDFSADDKIPDFDSVREWRSLIEAKLQNHRDQYYQISKLEKDFQTYFENTKKYLSQNKIIAKNENELTTHIKTCEKLKAEKLRLSEECNQEYKLIESSKSSIHHLNLLKVLKANEKEINSDLQKKTDELINNEDNLKIIDFELKKMYKAQTEIDNIDWQTSAYEADMFEQIQKLTNIKDMHSTWEIKKHKENYLMKEIIYCQTKIAEYNLQIAENESEYEIRENDFKKADQHYKELSANQTRLTTLLDEVELYVTGERCPLCGTNHKTREHLIQQVRAQKEFRPAIEYEITENYLKLKKSIETKKSNISELHEKYKKYISRENKLLDNLEKLQHENEQFEYLLKQVGIVYNESSFVQEISDLIMSKNENYQIYIENRKDNQATSDKNRLKIEEKKNKRLQLVESRKDIKSSIDDLKSQLYENHVKIDNLGLNLKTGIDVERTNFDNMMYRIDVANNKIQLIEKQLNSIDAQKKYIENKLAQITTDNKLANTAKGFLDKQISSYERIAFELFGENIELNKEKLNKKQKEVLFSVETYERLAVQTLTLERALDSFQRSAMLSELDNEGKRITMQKAEISKKIKQLSTTKEWFIQIGNLLNEYSVEAVRSHINSCGPLTSLIQKRLSTVYGFGEVQLKQIANEIEVLVDWHGKSVKPNDYFSDAQKQMLMLSLFLSERLSQTWSGFAPILLDDPVTHFDDLNAFGFVELIRGLVTTAPGKWQFFISTCDIRLFEIMQQKYANDDCNAKFYRFDNINEEGPVLEKL